jgi:hypothetical protein
MAKTIINDSLIVLGDSFSDCNFSWADYLSIKIGKPILKFTISGGSNELIWHKFMVEFPNLEITNSIILFQTSGLGRISVDVSPHTYAGDYLDSTGLREHTTSGDVVIIGPRTFLKNQFSKSQYPKLPIDTPIDYASKFNVSLEFSTMKLIHWCNLFNAVFRGSNKFMMVLGLYNEHHPYTAFDDFLKEPTFNISSYYTNGMHRGLDQYVIDINEVDNTGHPTNAGNILICDNLVYPRLKELNYV